MSYKEI